MASAGIASPHPDAERWARKLDDVRREVGRVVVGQREMIDRILLALIADGHVLIEGVPGLAKTTAVKAVADALHTSFARLQFTPDLLPADLVGTEIYRPNTGEFTVKKGPIFANLVLADEINRAPAKVQSALLEAMQERQVTISDHTFPLPAPFLVLATQNPVEQEGTYPLPEAQVDRFMLKLVVSYPTREEEREIARRMGQREKLQVQPVLSPQDLSEIRAAVETVYIDERVEDYVVSLITATRDPAAAGVAAVASLVQYGASPRATIALTRAARVHAFMLGRGFVTPHDVKTLAPDVLRHRLILTYEAEAQERTADDVIRVILGAVDVP